MDLNETFPDVSSPISIYGQIPNVIIYSTANGGP